MSGNERDADGKLRPGHSVGRDTKFKPGDKRRATPASIRANARTARARRAKAAANALTPNEIKALIRSQYAAACRGDSVAARNVLDRVIGKPGDAPPFAAMLDVPDVTRADGPRNLLARLVKEVAEGSVDAALARDVASLVTGLVEHETLAEVHRRLAELEGERRP